MDTSSKIISPINLEMLNELSGGDTEFIIDILSMVKDDTPNTISQLTNAIGDSNFETIKQVAHKYKSSINCLMDEHLNHLVNLIEINAAEPAKHNELSSLIDKLTRYSAVLTNNIQYEIERLNAKAA